MTTLVKNSTNCQKPSFVESLPEPVKRTGEIAAVAGCVTVLSPFLLSNLAVLGFYCVIGGSGHILGGTMVYALDSINNNNPDNRNLWQYITDGID